MSAYSHHHYVPRFLLAAWHSESDGRLAQFEWVSCGVGKCKFVVSRKYASATGWKKHYYSAAAKSSSPDVSLEKNYLGPKIESPASLIYKKMLAEEFPLELDEVSVWIKFIIAQHIRVPAQFERFKLLAKRLAEQYGTASFVKSLDEPLKSEFQQQLDDAMITVLPRFVDAKHWIQHLAKPNWKLIDLSSSEAELLISDHPIILKGKIGRRYCISLPLTPTKAFAIFSDAEMEMKFFRGGPAAIVERMNKRLVSQATQYVWSRSGTSHRELVMKHLSRPAKL